MPQLLARRLVEGPDALVLGRGDEDEASRRDQQRGFWLRGRLTVDPVQADLDFQRLVVLYPRGSFTPQAIFRLAQSAHAMGDVDAAAEYVNTLARDYRRSDVADDARDWLAEKLGVTAMP